MSLRYTVCAICTETQPEMLYVRSSDDVAEVITFQELRMRLLGHRYFTQEGVKEQRARASMRFRAPPSALEEHCVFLW